MINLQDANPRLEWRSVLPSFLLLASGELAIAILLAVPLTSALLASFGHRPALSALASGDWLSILAEIPPASLPEATSPSRGVEGSVSLAAIMTLLLSLVGLGLHGLLYTYISGPALAAMLGDRRGVRRAAGTWFFPMLRIGLLLALALGVLGIGGALALFVSPLGLPAPAKIAICLVWVATIGSLFELARAWLPAARSLSAVRAIAGASGLLARRPLAVLATWLLLAAGNLALYALIAAISLYASASNPTVAWAVTVFTVVAASAYKLLRLAAQLRLIEKHPAEG